MSIGPLRKGQAVIIVGDAGADDVDAGRLQSLECRLLLQNALLIGLVDEVDADHRRRGSRSRGACERRRENEGCAEHRY